MSFRNAIGFFGATLMVMSAGCSGTAPDDPSTGSADEAATELTSIAKIPLAKGCYGNKPFERATLEVKNETSKPRRIQAVAHEAFGVGSHQTEQEVVIDAHASVPIHVSNTRDACSVPDAKGGGACLLLDYVELFEFSAGAHFTWKPPQQDCFPIP
jgi:hypothetical protein